ncbi:hypothetical protein [Zobellia nedashkovskayae]|uniref:hypothetical protein n=1 Tax=Zobellia nedashkovskayae TaxID=2779510 RepID=UPI00188B3BE7|nr:hypothetical protein [Zobellia nedashkovskayae]
MKKFYHILLLSLTLIACEQSGDDDIQNKDLQEDVENLILKRVESILDWELYKEVIIYNDDLSYDLNNRLTNWSTKTNDDPSISIDITYSGNQIVQIGEFSVTYDEDKITLISPLRKEEFFIQNGKVVMYKWYQFNTDTSSFRLVVTNKYTYDKDFRNTIRTDEFNADGELRQYATYEYDNKINPYRNINNVLSVVSFMELGFFGTDSENNVVRMESFTKFNDGFNSRVFTITYSYNDLNYPTNLKRVGEDYSLEQIFIYEE